MDTLENSDSSLNPVQISDRHSSSAIKISSSHSRKLLESFLKSERINIIVLYSQITNRLENATYQMFFDEQSNTFPNLEFRHCYYRVPKMKDLQETDILIFVGEILDDEVFSELQKYFSSVAIPKFGLNITSSLSYNLSQELQFFNFVILQNNEDSRQGQRILPNGSGYYPDLRFMFKDLSKSAVFPSLKNPQEREKILKELQTKFSLVKEKILKKDKRGNFAIFLEKDLELLTADLLSLIKELKKSWNVKLYYLDSLIEIFIDKISVASEVKYTYLNSIEEFLSVVRSHDFVITFDYLSTIVSLGHSYFVLPIGLHRNNRNLIYQSGFQNFGYYAVLDVYGKPYALNITSIIEKINLILARYEEYIEKRLNFLYITDIHFNKFSFRRLLEKCIKNFHKQSLIPEAPIENEQVNYKKYVSLDSSFFTFSDQFSVLFRPYHDRKGIKFIRNIFMRFENEILIEPWIAFFDVEDYHVKIQQDSLSEDINSTKEISTKLTLGLLEKWKNIDNFLTSCLHCVGLFVKDHKHYKFLNFFFSRTGRMVPITRVDYPQEILIENSWSRPQYNFPKINGSYTKILTLSVNKVHVQEFRQLRTNMKKILCCFNRDHEKYEEFSYELEIHQKFDFNKFDGVIYVPYFDNTYIPEIIQILILAAVLNRFPIIVPRITILEEVFGTDYPFFQDIVNLNEIPIYNHNIKLNPLGLCVVNNICHSLRFYI